jgi:hypothetical protein
LYVAGAIAFDRNDLPRGLEVLKRSTEMQESDKDDWMLRFKTATRAQDHADAAVSLRTLATRWPDTLSTLDEWFVPRTVAQSPKRLAGSMRRWNS